MTLRAISNLPLQRLRPPLSYYPTQTILQLHVQALGLGVPPQLMSALPYLATVAVLVLISRVRRGRWAAPAALGTGFVPER